jgi:C-terminal processing protease CtpA/Prc
MTIKNRADKRFAALVGVFLTFASVTPMSGDKQTYTALTNTQVLSMLNQIEQDIKENYYDSSMHGIDLDKKFEEVRGKIAGAHSQDEALLQVAGAVGILHDSHTWFNPPVRPYQVDYGFLMQAIGDSSCYVTEVHPGSDAETKGLKRGDRIMAINGVPIVRQDINVVEYGYRVFPQSGLHIDIRSPEGTQKSLVLMAKVTVGQKVISRSDVLNWARSHPSEEEAERFFGEGNQSQFHAVEKKALFWRLPSFMIDPLELESQANKARSYSFVVLDLRGNPGGRLDALEAFSGVFFDHDIKLGNEKGRKGLKPIVVKGRGKSAIGSSLIVLIDSESSSAAEVFSRLIQLEKRGIVLGDLSSGRVMESEYFIHAVSLNQQNVTQYGASVTIRDILMSDGKSIENAGVMPDERILPVPADIAAGDDPVLARAAAIAGLQMSSQEAGKLFPFKWPDKPLAMD